VLEGHFYVVRIRLLNLVHRIATTLTVRALKIRELNDGYFSCSWALNWALADIDLYWVLKLLFKFLLGLILLLLCSLLLLLLEVTLEAANSCSEMSA